MSTQTRNPCGPGQSGAGDAEQPQPDESAGADMHQAMSRMMAHCGCGPGMMAKMAGMMGAHAPSKPAEPAPPEEQ